MKCSSPYQFSSRRLNFGASPTGLVDRPYKVFVKDLELVEVCPSL